MQNSIHVHNPNLRRFVHDFDALADVLHTLIDRERPTNSPGEAAPDRDMEFTTEWQMTPSTERMPQEELVHPSY